LHLLLELLYLLRLLSKYNYSAHCVAAFTITTSTTLYAYSLQFTRAIN
jgi:hypothetical protein